MSMVPEDLRYTEEHEWIRDNGDTTVTVGITDYAQHELDDVVYVKLPAIKTQLNQSDEFGFAESCKATSELYAPISGEVVEVNAQLDNAPELVNQNPYGDGWMIKMRLADPSEVEKLMDAAAYGTLVAMLEKEKE